MIINVPRRHRLIISVNSPSHYEVADITRKSRAEYAKKHNADFIEVLDDAMDKGIGMFNKYRITRYAVNYYQTLYLDGDIIIRDDAPNLFEAGPSNHFMFRDELPVIKQNNSQEYINKFKLFAREFSCNPCPNFCPNAGILVIPQHLASLYNPPNKVSTFEWCFDQYYLAIQLQKNNALGQVTYLPQDHHLMYIEQDFWEKLPDSKIIHLNGSNNGPYRVELAKRFMEGNFEFFLPEGKCWLPQWPKLRDLKRQTETPRQTRTTVRTAPTKKVIPGL